MKTYLAISVLALAAGFTAPACAQQKLVPAQSEIAFTSKQMGVPVDGKFRKFDANVAFDPKRPEAAKIGFTIDIGSATLGSAETEAELVKPDWFNTKLFPQATFQSGAVKASGPGKFEVAGKLTIKGTTKDVVVPATFTPQGNTGVFEGSLTIQRGDFSIGEGAWKAFDVVANDVVIKFRITAAAK